MALQTEFEAEANVEFDGNALPAEYFEDPLTTATFDRTPALRMQRAKVGAEVRSSAVDKSAVERVTNQRMFGWLAGVIETEITDRVNAEVGRSVSQREHPTLDRKAIQTHVSAEYRRDLATLHAALPLPDLDRLAVREPVEVAFFPEDVPSSILADFVFEDFGVPQDQRPDMGRTQVRQMLIAGIDLAREFFRD